MSVLIINYNPSGLYNRNEVLNCLIIASWLKRHRQKVEVCELSDLPGTFRDQSRYICITSREESVYHLAKKIRESYPNKRIIFFHEYFKYYINSDLTDVVDMIVSGNNFNAILDYITDSSEIDSDINSSIWKKDGVTHYNETSNTIPLEKIGKLPYADYPDMGIYEEAAFKDNPFEQGKDTALIFYSRGCKHNCTFCVNPIFYRKKIFYRKPEDVVKDISFFVKNGIYHFSFEDENLIADRKKAEVLFKKIKGSGLNIRFRCHASLRDIDEKILGRLSEIGCRRIDLGVETASLEMQKKIHKINGVQRVINVCRKIKDLAIEPYILMIIGLPGENSEALCKTERFLDELVENNISFGISLFRPIPGTDYENASNTGSDFSMHGKDVLHYMGKETDVENLKRIYKKFTGRVILMPSQQPYCKTISQIDPFLKAEDFTDANFSPVPLNIWTGDRWDEISPAHIVGRFKGFIKYEFLSESKGMFDVKVKIRCCSQTTEKSEIKVRINNSYQMVSIPEKTKNGKLLSVQLYDVVITKENELEFICDSNQGLTLFLSLYEDEEQNKSIEILIPHLL